MARLRMRPLWLGKVSLVLVTLAILGMLGYIFLALFVSLASADAALQNPCLLPPLPHQPQTVTDAKICFKFSVGLDTSSPHLAQRRPTSPVNGFASRLRLTLPIYGTILRFARRR